MFKKFMAWWKLIALVAVVVLAIMIPIEFIYHLPEEQVLLLHDIELVIIVILALDLVFQYIVAKNKAEFVKKNWWQVLLFIPYIGSIRVLRLLKLRFGSAFSTAKVVAHASRLLRVLRAVVFFIKEIPSKIKKKLSSKKKSTETQMNN